MSTHAAHTPPAAAPRRRTVVFVSTHCSVRNWAEKRLYEPLAPDHDVHLVFWDRSGLLSARGLDEARRLGLTLHEFPNRPWNLRSLIAYFSWFGGTLDRIHVASGIDVVLGADTDVLPGLVWHRMRRGLRYRIFRHEVDYYAGSRHTGKTLRARFMRWLYDLIEAGLHLAIDKVLTLNRHSAARLRAWGLPARKIAISGLWKKDLYWTGDREGAKDGLLAAGLVTPERHALLKGKVVVFFCGFFYPGTHVRELMDAVVDFPAQVVLIAAGRGQETPIVEDYARRHANIVFLGWIDEDDFLAWYQATDIVYQPLNPEVNPNWKYFGSTNKTFESIASGSLFIGSAINERVDLRNEEDWAEFIDFRRDISTQMRAVFRRILDDPAYLPAKQAAARRLFARYHHGRVAEDWRRLVDET